jgi:hypothetical protein
MNPFDKIERDLAELRDLYAYRVKYVTAKQAEALFGIPQKTLLNRSQLDETHPRHIPSYRMKGGKRKTFDTRVLEALFIPTTIIKSI